MYYKRDECIDEPCKVLSICQTNFAKRVTTMQARSHRGGWGAGGARARQFFNKVLKLKEQKLLGHQPFCNTNIDRKNGKSRTILHLQSFQTHSSGRRNFSFNGYSGYVPATMTTVVHFHSHVSFKLPQLINGTFERNIYSHHRMICYHHIRLQNDNSVDTAKYFCTRVHVYMAEHFGTQYSR